MKRISLIFAIIPLTALTLFAGHVDSETARKVATTFLNNNGAKATQLTDLSKAAGFNNLYIFNGNPGFVVMSADNCVQPILGYSLTGSFEAEEMPENVSSWLQGYSDEIQYAIDHQMRASSETAKLWKDLAEGNSKTGRTTVVVSPLIQTRWNQNKYYNRLCPVASNGPDGHALTGCVATAMAQIMKYYNYPASGIGSHSYTWNNQTQSAIFWDTQYDWNNMNNYYEYYYDDDVYHTLPTPTSDEIKAVATLMYHCGVSVNMKYSGSSSGTATAYVASALKTYFNYDSGISFKQKAYYSNSEWNNMVKTELNNNRPLQYSGQDPEEGGGHSFVCDGYGSSDNNDFFHFNWGWAGHYDGYFSLDNLDTGANSGEAGAGNGVYTSDQAAVFGIQPSRTSTAQAPSGLTYSQSNNVTTLNWTLSDGAASYNIYRNECLIGNSTVNSYSDNSPCGTNVYYVRSLDSNGILSLSSNSVSVSVSYPSPIVNDMSVSLADKDAQLSWTSPDWCYPESPSETLNYGDGAKNYSWSCKFYAHKYPASQLTPYNGMILYKISTFMEFGGDYTAFIYLGSTSNNQPETLVSSSIVYSVNSFNTWLDMDLNNRVILSDQQDLWVVLRLENTGETYQAPSFNLATYNENACFGGSSPTSLGNPPTNYPVSWFINSYLSDGTYTYNLYDGTTKVNGTVPITGTSYTINNLADGIHQFTVKTNYYGNESEASNMAGLTLGTAPALETLKLGSGNVMTVASGSTLTVTGTLTNDDPANLVMENGSQLFYSSNTKATVKKSINGYSTSDSQSGWYLIASPLTDQLNITEGTNLTNAGDFDLYIFDQTNNKEWLNYKQNHFTTIENKKGYLYAHKDGIDIEFSGTVNNTSGSVDLTYSSGYTFSGYNLVGNPYPCNATISREYYRIVETSEGSKLQLASSAIAPMEGILVKSTGTSDNNIIFTKESGSKEDNDTKAMINLTITKGQDDILDKACIHFDGDYNMEKITFRDAGTQLYLTQNGKQYALLVIDQQTEVPISFKASTDGEYTLTVTAPLTSHLSTLNFKSLHLVDNLTGADIDLLQNPSYNFEAKANDYAARFKLVFNTEANNNTYSEDFVEGKTTIIDMTGRVVATDRNTQLAPGVYIIRTVNGNETNSKKIIINK